MEIHEGQEWENATTLHLSSDKRTPTGLAIVGTAAEFQPTERQTANHMGAASVYDRPVYQPDYSSFELMSMGRMNWRSVASKKRLPKRPVSKVFRRNMSGMGSSYAIDYDIENDGMGGVDYTAVMGLGSMEDDATMAGNRKKRRAVNAVRKVRRKPTPPMPNLHGLTTVDLDHAPLTMGSEDYFRYLESMGYDASLGKSFFQKVASKAKSVTKAVTKSPIINPLATVKAVQKAAPKIVPKAVQKALPKKIATVAKLAINPLAQAKAVQKAAAKTKIIPKGMKKDLVSAAKIAVNPLAQVKAVKKAMPKGMVKSIAKGANLALNPLAQTRAVAKEMKPLAKQVQKTFRATGKDLQKAMPDINKGISDIAKAPVDVAKWSGAQVEKVAAGGAKAVQSTVDTAMKVGEKTGDVLWQGLRAGVELPMKPLMAVGKKIGDFVSPPKKPKSPAAAAAPQMEEAVTEQAIEEAYPDEAVAYDEYAEGGGEYVAEGEAPLAPGEEYIEDSNYPSEESYQPEAMAYTETEQPTSEFDAGGEYLQPGESYVDASSAKQEPEGIAYQPSGGALIPQYPSEQSYEDAAYPVPSGTTQAEDTAYWPGEEGTSPVMQASLGPTSSEWDTGMTSSSLYPSASEFDSESSYSEDYGDSSDFSTAGLMGALNSEIERNTQATAALFYKMGDYMSPAQKLQLANMRLELEKRNAELKAVKEQLIKQNGGLDPTRQAPPAPLPPLSPAAQTGYSFIPTGNEFWPTQETDHFRTPGSMAGLGYPGSMGRVRNRREGKFFRAGQRIGRG